MKTMNVNRINRILIAVLTSFVGFLSAADSAVVAPQVPAPVAVVAPIKPAVVKPLPPTLEEAIEKLVAQAGVAVDVKDASLQELISYLKNVVAAKKINPIHFAIFLASPEGKVFAKQAYDVMTTAKLYRSGGHTELEVAATLTEKVEALVKSVQVLQHKNFVKKILMWTGIATAITIAVIVVLVIVAIIIALVTGASAVGIWAIINAINVKKNNALPAPTEKQAEILNSDVEEEVKKIDKENEKKEELKKIEEQKKLEQEKKEKEEKLQEEKKLAEQKKIEEEKLKLEKEKKEKEEKLEKEKKDKEEKMKLEKEKKIEEQKKLEEEKQNKIKEDKKRLEEINKNKFEDAKQLLNPLVPDNEKKKIAIKWKHAEQDFENLAINFVGDDGVKKLKEEIKEEIETENEIKLQIQNADNLLTDLNKSDVNNKSESQINNENKDEDKKIKDLSVNPNKPSTTQIPQPKPVVGKAEKTPGFWAKWFSKKPANKKENKNEKKPVVKKEEKPVVKKEREVNFKF